MNVSFECPQSRTFCDEAVSTKTEDTAAIQYRIFITPRDINDLHLWPFETTLYRDAWATQAVCWTFELYSTSFQSVTTPIEQTNRETDRRTDGRRERESSKRVRPLSQRALRRRKKLRIVNRKKLSSWVVVEETVRQPTTQWKHDKSNFEAHEHTNTRARALRGHQKAPSCDVFRTSVIASKVLGKLRLESNSLE